ncbi:hypothetical protein [Burkholderia cepacia]|uniref:hypothetical protein n=1 Tax=Burkholderia cepacia TaxID=292 RepID=UPI0009C04FEA|nr:hypothetical protein [Burkholderia cepacia]
MTDRELLEAAARAAGMVVVSDYDGATWAHLADEHPEQAARWNPLDDDGDALRLAVKFGLNIDVHRGSSVDGWPCVEVRGYVHRRLLTVEHAQDNDASLADATRRAIVRAAVEIGKKVDAPQERAD